MIQINFQTCAPHLMYCIQNEWSFDSTTTKMRYFEIYGSQRPQTSTNRCGIYNFIYQLKRKQSSVCHRKKVIQLKLFSLFFVCLFYDYIFCLAKNFSSTAVTAFFPLVLVYKIVYSAQIGVKFMSLRHLDLEIQLFGHFRPILRSFYIVCFPTFKLQYFHKNLSKIKNYFFNSACFFLIYNTKQFLSEVNEYKYYKKTFLAKKELMTS